MKTLSESPSKERFQIWFSLCFKRFLVKWICYIEGSSLSFEHFVVKIYFKWKIIRCGILFQIISRHCNINRSSSTPHSRLSSWKWFLFFTCYCYPIYLLFWTFQNRVYFGLELIRILTEFEGSGFFFFVIETGEVWNVLLCRYFDVFRGEGKGAFEDLSFRRYSSFNVR